MSDSLLREKIKSIIEPNVCSLAKLQAMMHEINELVTGKPNFDDKKPGDRFTYKGIEWAILGEEAGGVLCITSDVICRKEFDKCGSNNWKNSSLRWYLNTEFVAKLDKDDLIAMECDLVADNGDKAYGKTTDFVGLLSCDLYRKYRDIIPRYECLTWTCTPWTCAPNYASHVRKVYSSGGLGGYVADVDSGVVPAVIFKKRG